MGGGGGLAMLKGVGDTISFGLVLTQALDVFSYAEWGGGGGVVGRAQIYSTL